MRWKTLIILAWIGVFLVLAELALELRGYLRGWDTLLLGQRASVESARAGSDARYGPTASFPFRSRVHTKARSPGVPRIWVASASYAAGNNVAPARVFPSRVEALLRERGAPCEVLNAGREGTTIVGNIDELRREGADWQPDFVLLYQMSLDVDDLTRRILAPDIVAGEDAERGDEPWFRPGLWLEYTTAYPTLKSVVSARLTKARVLCDSLGVDGADRFTTRLHDLLAVVDDLGATPVLSTFAVSHERDHPDDIPLHVYRYNIRLSREGWHDSIDRWHERLRGLATAQGIVLADVRAAVSGRSELFVDFVHFNEEGHERAARVLADALEPLVRGFGSGNR